MELHDWSEALARNDYLRDKMEEATERRNAFYTISDNASELTSRFGEHKVEKDYEADTHASKLWPGWTLFVESRHSGRYIDNTIITIQSLPDEQGNDQIVFLSDIDEVKHDVFDQNGNPLPLEDLRKLNKTIKQLLDLAKKQVQ